MISTNFGSGNITKSLQAIGYVFKEERKRKRYSQRFVAENLNITHPYVSMIENGKRKNVSFKILLDYANLLGLDFPEVILKADVVKLPSEEEQTLIFSKLTNLIQELKEFSEE